MRLSLDAFALGEGPTRGDYLTWAFIRYDELCLFEALHPAPLARPFSKGLLARDYLTWAFIPLRRVVPLRGTPSCAFGAALLQGPTRGSNAIKLSGRSSLAPHRGSCPKGLCKRTGFLGVKRREIPVRRHFEQSEMRGLRSGIA